MDDDGTVDGRNLVSQWRWVVNVSLIHPMIFFLGGKHFIILYIDSLDMLRYIYHHLSTAANPLGISTLMYGLCSAFGNNNWNQAWIAPSASAIPKR